MRLANRRVRSPKAASAQVQPMSQLTLLLPSASPLIDALRPRLSTPTIDLGLATSLPKACDGLSSDGNGTPTYCIASSRKFYHLEGIMLQFFSCFVNTQYYTEICPCI